MQNGIGGAAGRGGGPRPVGWGGWHMGTMARWHGGSSGAGQMGIPMREGVPMAGAGSCPRDEEPLAGLGYPRVDGEPRWGSESPWQCEGPGARVRSPWQGWGGPAAMGSPGGAKLGSPRPRPPALDGRQAGQIRSQFQAVPTERCYQDGTCRTEYFKALSGPPSGAGTGATALAGGRRRGRGERRRQRPRRASGR